MRRTSLFSVQKLCPAGREKGNSFIQALTGAPLASAAKVVTRSPLAGRPNMQSSNKFVVRPCNGSFLGGTRVKSHLLRSPQRVTICSLVLLLALLVTPAGAVDFYGSAPLGSTGLVVGPGVDLLNTDQFHLTQVFGNPGSGDFGSVPYFMILTPEDWLLNLSDFSGLSLGSEEFGTFTANSGSVISRSSNFVNVELTGLFAHSSVEDAGADLHFAMTQTGESISWSGTLSVDSGQAGNVVPEPSSAPLGIIGAVSLLLLTRRRRRR